MGPPRANTRKQPKLGSKHSWPGPLDVLPLDEDDAVDAGTARAALERVGTSIGVYETC